MLCPFYHLAFIGPGGPEIIVVMLVLLLMFGAKDAPRMFRKINEIINSIRNTADGFKREILYSDMTSDVASNHDSEDPAGYDDDYHYDEDEEYEDSFSDLDLETPEQDECDYSDETFQGLEHEVVDPEIPEPTVNVKKDEGDNAGKA